MTQDMTAKNEQEVQSKVQMIRDCYYAEKTKNKKCMVLKFVAKNKCYARFVKYFFFAI